MTNAIVFIFLFIIASISINFSTLAMAYLHAFDSNKDRLYWFCIITSVFWFIIFYVLGKVMGVM